MKLRTKRVLAILLVCVAAAMLFAGCQSEKEPENSISQVVYMGKDQDIPCIELLDMTYSTSDVVEWEFQEMARENNKSYGIATEKVVEKSANVFNWYVGDGVYQNKYIKVKPGQYETLIAEMTNAGYQICSQGNINLNCYYTLLTYQENVYNVTYFMEANHIYVTASKARPISPLLLEDNYSTQSPAVEGVEPTVTMLQTTDGGDCYVMQLKNGHYILFDGGSVGTFANTLDYLTAHAPAGQTPVVDAWFITHGHYDHIGWTAAYYRTNEQLAGLLYQGEAAERLRVNGVYYSHPTEQIIDHTIYGWRSDGYRNKLENEWPYMVKLAVSNMKTETGEPTQIYRPQAGQTYYFHGMTVEVPYCQEQITFAEYQMDINASSTWYLVRAEGRTFLEAGDSENINMSFVEHAYSNDYVIFDGKLDLMSAFHHGHNVYDEFIDTFWAPQMFYTTQTMFKWATQYTNANKAMIQNHKITYYYHGDGAYQFNFNTGIVTKIS